jgi:hypothetical protein
VKEEIVGVANGRIGGGRNGWGGGDIHKITNVPVFYMAFRLHGFDAGKSITPII